MRAQDNHMFFVETPEDVLYAKSKLSSEFKVAFDTETNGLHKTKYTVAGFCLVTEAFRCYVPLAHPGSKVLDPGCAWEFLNDVVQTVPEIWMHNAAFDVRVAAQHGVYIPLASIRDTILAAFLLGEPEIGLKALIKKLLGYTSPSYQDVTMGFTADLLPAALVGAYCIADGIGTLKIGELLVAELLREGMYNAWLDIECPFSAVVAHMEATGILFDTKFVAKFREDIQASFDEVTAKLRRHLGDINLTSSKDLAKLFDMGIWESKFKREDEITGNLHIDAEFLKFVSINSMGKGGEVATLLLQHRKLSKLLTTYTDSLISASTDHADGRIRSSFNQTVTNTLRLSSSAPNLQNIPSKSDEGKILRKAFQPHKGYIFIDTDLSQVELRLLAHYSQDKNMLLVYCQGIDAAGDPMKDLHQKTQKELTILMRAPADRGLAKSANFGLGYGMGPVRFANTYLKGATKETISTAKVAISAFFSAYPGIKGYHKSILDFFARHNYVRLLAGQKIRFSSSVDHYSDVINAPIQGSAASVMKLAFINIYRTAEVSGLLNTDLKIVSTIHDEAIVEVKKELCDWALPVIRSCFEYTTHQLGISVPLKADPTAGNDWLEAHS